MLETIAWQQGWQALGLQSTAAQQQQLGAYLALLQRWNKVHNLTAVRDPADMLVLHLWDSLSVVPFVTGEHCLDVGSGAGLPGIPLAILNPEQHWTLLDTNGKKTRFMQQAVGELGLKNVTVIQTRVESWQPTQRFNSIISRAFASVVDFIQSSGQHLAEDGVLYAMKGRYPQDELAHLPIGWQLHASHVLHVPNLAAERHLLELIPTQ
ncbi:16S rRNA (guanine(527)-N(7))-methyltransferase RsmG [Thiofilum flexile]|uniref:16S rRNA (guanine(527)-N(7))-methyltransferase RsmG n=1 Tax=Thiofilum flexile TaxID=125627 RepID=UPI000362F942|nr:16S rRNA (guanine(527)-N(7))-methyltransferase RsmG [Thiofilum flexile]